MKYNKINYSYLQKILLFTMFTLDVAQGNKCWCTV